MIEPQSSTGVLPHMLPATPRPQPVPELSGDRRVDRALLTLARLLAEIAASGVAISPTTNLTTMPN